MNFTIAVLQADLSRDYATNVAKITAMVKSAAEQGAQVILPSELFAGIYFCQEEREEYFSWALPADNHPLILHFQKLASDLQVVLPISFFERSHQVFYNSVAVIDADGRVLGIYRKSHIPDGPGYEEKFYFRGGNTGFRVWQTRYGRVGVGICWDQWFPECARAMTLLGAEVLLYPTAIGSEPNNPELNTYPLWQRAMIGHAVCNMIPIGAANRIGTEGNQSFYGHSFICNHRGEVIAELDDQTEGVILAQFDRELIDRQRASFGFFRDRRPDLYGILTE